MSNDLATTKLGVLQGIVEQTLGSRSTRGGDSTTSVPNDQWMQQNAEKLENFYKCCTLSKVFGSKPGGVLPAARSDDPNSQVSYAHTIPLALILMTS